MLNKHSLFGIYMVNRVNDGQYTNAYINTKRQKIKTDAEAPAFLLNYDERGVIWDRDEASSKSKEEQVREKRANEAKSQKKNSPAVKETKEASANERPAFLNPWSVESLIGAIKNLAKSIKYVFDGFLKLVWYGEEDTKKDQTAQGEEEKNITEFEEKSELENISEENNLLSKDEKASKFVSDFDKKLEAAKAGVDGTLARNTDLLTTYDRFGHTVSPSKSNQSLILHGDKAYKV